MPPRPDSQTYTRFLLSAGVFLVAAAFIGPGLVLRETDVLQISTRELAEATPVGRQELERRQRIARDVGEAVPIVALGLLVGGIALIFFAVPRLRRQEIEDEERSSIELDKLRAEVTPQTEAERKERLSKDMAASGFGDEEAARQERAASTGGPVSVAGPAWFRAVDAHRMVLARLTQLGPPDYEVRPEVKIAGPRHLLLDALLVSRAGRPDIVVEIKLTNPRSPANIKKGIDQLAAQLNGYREHFPGRAAVGWLILVLDGEPMTAAARERLVSALGSRKEQVHVSVVGRGDVESLRLPLT